MARQVAPGSDSPAGQAPADGKARVPGRPLPRATPDSIATGLQLLFAPVAAEPIPDDFLALLDRIDAAAAEAARDGGEGTPA